MVAIRQMKKIRELVNNLVTGLEKEQLFQVPDGFRNHIAWNTGHLIVTQQIIHYGLSGLDPLIPQELLDLYRKGTDAAAGDEQSFDAVLPFLESAPLQLQEDYDAGAFETFTTYETSTGIVLHHINEAILFNNTHEGIHLGYMMAMRKQLR